MIISRELYLMALERAGEDMQEEWLALHQHEADGAAGAIREGHHGTIYEAGDEYDVWMMWTALTRMGHHVKVVQSHGRLTVNC